MAKGCCCFGLAKGWWWLLTLLGLTLLYLLMLSARWGGIETDLHSRTTEELSEKGINWSNVDVNHRGRDILLTGTASTEAERDNAINTALSVEGVRIVDSNIDITPLKKRQLMAHYNHENKQLVLKGALSSQAEIDGVVKIVTNSIGSQRVINKLTVSDQYAKEGGSMILTGSVLSNEALTKISKAVKTGGSALGLALTNNLDIDRVAIQAIKEQEKKVAAEQEESDRLAAETATAEKIAAEQAESEKLAAEKAKAEKIAAEKAEMEKLATEKVKSEKIAAKQAKIEVEKTKASDCQTKLNRTMLDKTILFNTNKAEIKDSSFSLLKKIAAIIRECGTILANAKITVSGHTDSRGSDEDNLKLSGRRSNAVKIYLTSIGVSAEMVRSKGYGESQPIATNDTPEGRAKNRRITFSVK
jgi:outer membrane protein OmpA-like peptidoglycan-associated protein/osmotically-inducible protein OsmY